MTDYQSEFLPHLAKMLSLSKDLTKMLFCMFRDSTLEGFFLNGNHGMWKDS